MTPRPPALYSFETRPAGYVRGACTFCLINELQARLQIIRNPLPIKHIRNDRNAFHLKGLPPLATKWVPLSMEPHPKSNRNVYLARITPSAVTPEIGKRKIGRLPLAAHYVYAAVLERQKTHAPEANSLTPATAFFSPTATGRLQ